eukprot:222438_1
MNVKETAEQLLTEYKSTHQQDSNKQFLPLQQYTKENICDMITYVRLTDIFYKKQLIDIMKVFCEKNLNGKEVSGYKGNILKLMVQDDLKKIFITDATIDIMFDYFDKLKEEQTNDFITDKNAAEIAYELYMHPLNRLQKQIIDENIDGNMFIEKHEHDRIISNATGWTTENIYQIEAFLFQKQTLTNQKILKNIYHKHENNEYRKFEDAFAKIAYNIQNQLKGFDLEQIHYKMKHGKRGDYGNKNTKHITHCQDEKKAKEQFKEEKKLGKSAAIQNEFDGTAKVPYFVQITEVTEDDFTIALRVVETTKKHRKFRLKEISNIDIEVAKITLRQNTALSYEVIDFDDFNVNDKDTYIFALYEKNKGHKTNIIKLTKYPLKLDINAYKPNCID